MPSDHSSEDTLAQWSDAIYRTMQEQLFASDQGNSPTVDMESLIRMSNRMLNAPTPDPSVLNNDWFQLCYCSRGSTRPGNRTVKGTFDSLKNKEEQF